MSNPRYLPVMLDESSYTEHSPWYFINYSTRVFGYPVFHQMLCFALSIKLQLRIQETNCHILFITHSSYLKFNVHSLNKFKVNIFTL